MDTSSNKKLDRHNRKRTPSADRSSSTSQSFEIKTRLQPVIKQWLRSQHLPEEERKAIGRTIRKAYRQGKTIDAIQGMELPASIKQLLSYQEKLTAKISP